MGIRAGASGFGAQEHIASRARGHESSQPLDPRSRGFLHSAAMPGADEAEVRRLVREAVERATVKETNGRRMFAGAVSVEACFTMRRPKRAKGREFPSVAPDLDKLLRRTFDGLTSSGVWEDDSRVVSVSASKVYPKQGKDALAVPGAVIRIWEAA